ncbi:hypothetical protein ACN469_19035 [Corallococcus terminator]
MKMKVRCIGLGLLALAASCGDNPLEDSSATPPEQLQASPAQEMPSEQALAATHTAEALTAVPVRYVVDPTTTTQFSASAGVEETVSSSSSRAVTPGAARRSLK